MRDISQMGVAEIISVTGGLAAGIMLVQITGILEQVPAILILIPAFFETNGNVGGSLAARLGTALHLGLVKGKKGSKIVRNNILASFLVTMLSSLFMGFLTWGLAILVGVNTHDWLIIPIALFAGLISGLINIFFTTFATTLLFKHDYDPDDIMGPVVTTLGDIFSTLSLIMAAMVILGV
jgi:mgtE-like transporter